MRRRWCLPIFMLIGVVGLYINMYIRIEVQERNDRSQVKAKNNYLSPAKCAGISGIILNRTLKNIKPNFFRKYMNDLQRCPWKYRKSEHDLLKLKFSSCCNASHMLVASQQNILLGQNLQFETSSKSVMIDEDIFQMLPMTSPFTSKPFDTCAVVGNGGIIQNSYCGREIDKMDFVFRFNLPPMTIVDDIGTKSNFVSANPSILNNRFKKLLERRKSFIKLVKSYGSAMIILPAFSYASNMHVSFRVLHSVEDFDLPNKIVFFHPEYLKNLSIFWKEEGLKATRLSSGLMLVSAAIELCKKVTLYGFWPFPQDPEGNTISHHYYDDLMPKPGFHSMPEEFNFYAQMHLKGVLHLKVGRCTLGGS